MQSETILSKPILNALAGHASSSPPLWLMRQAGRYLPEYRQLRTQAANFLEFCFTPDMAIEATLQPIRRFGLDGAVLFSDILTIPWGLGQKVEFLQGEGPHLEALRSADDLGRLQLSGVTERLSAVYQTVAGVKAKLPQDTALIGFAGAPWTVAAYMAEGHGSRDFLVARAWALGDPQGFGKLIDMIVDATIEHLSAQIAAGADLVQIFDSWSGVLAEDEFRRWVIEPTRRLVEGLRQCHPTAPIIGFPRGAGGSLAAYAAETGVTAVGLDTQVPLNWALSELPANLPVQGNLDPVALMLGGRALEEGVAHILEQTAGRPFIFNLGHGVHQTTPPENVARLVELVRGR
jgi:uroporphyrinogen decarboxylase